MLILRLFGLLLPPISALLLGDEPQQRLLHALFQRYDRRIRPLANELVGDSYMPLPVHINVTIVLGILIEMRENEQVAAYVISHTQRWHDHRLSWDPAEHGNIKELIVPQRMLWQPKMFVYNSMDTKDMLSDEKYDVRLRWDGQVKANIPQYVTCTCRLGIEQFPFDTQFCAIALASPLLTVEEMAVHSSQPPNESYFAGNSEWNLINVSVKDMPYREEGEFRAEVHYVFHLRRRPIFYIIVIVVPIFLISMLSILGIFTPGSNEGPRGEKVSLGLGSLLAMTVLLGIVAGAMPKSNSIPLLGYYILSVILLCAIAVAVSMAFMTASKRYVDSARVPSKFTYRMSLVRPKLYTVKTVKAMEQTKREPMARTKSLTRPIRGIRFSEQYEVPSGDEDSAAARRPSPVAMSAARANYGSIGGEECRNGGMGQRRKSRASNGAIWSGIRAAESSRTETDRGSELEEWEEGGLTRELARIRAMLSYVANSQKAFRAKLEREQTREQIELEWGRVFIKLDYVCLVVFQLLNVLSLLFFLRFAWADSPKEPDRPLV